MDISKVVLSSDFDTLKNESFISGSITIPNNVIIPGNSSVVYRKDIPVSNTPIDDTAYSIGGVWYMLCTQQATIDRTGIIAGGSYAYSLIVFAYYSSPTTIGYEIFIPNPYNVPLNTGAGVTVSFRSALYTDPFA